MKKHILKPKLSTNKIKAILCGKKKGSVKAALMSLALLTCVAKNAIILSTPNFSPYDKIRKALEITDNVISLQYALINIINKKSY
jgi:hypothetical protein